MAFFELQIPKKIQSPKDEIISTDQKINHTDINKYIALLGMIESRIFAKSFIESTGKLV